MKSGYRSSIRKKNKHELKYRTKEFYSIIAKLEDVARELYNKNSELEEVTEQWVIDNAPEVLGREPDSMEVMVIASRMWHLMDGRTDS